jgi:hypothetical protein
MNKQIGVMIRRRERTNPNRLEKEIKTLHKKISKNDDIRTYHSLGRDTNKSGFHSHLFIEYNDDKNLSNELNKFVGGNGWNTEQQHLRELKTTNGKWGEIHTHNIYNKEDFFDYMNNNNGLIKSYY